MTITLNGVKLSDRTVAYLETALWSSTVMLPVAEDELVDGYMDVDDDHALADLADGEPLDDHFGVDDFTADALRKAESELNDFFDRMESNGLTEATAEHADDDRVGHDFWLTRNGHGAGFWDGDYDGDEENLGDNLTELSKAFGEQNVMIDDDGQLHLEG